jgi:hypothetical protein
MQIEVDGYTFTVLSRQLLDEYNSLLVRVEKVPTGGMLSLAPLQIFTPIAPPVSSTRLFVRSNSWGGMFRVCLQKPNDGYLEKADDYTRGTFAKMELQVFFSKIWNTLDESVPLPEQLEECSRAFKQLPNYMDRMKRCTGTVLDDIELLGKYTYDFDLPNSKIVSKAKANEYTRLSVDQRQHFYDTTIRLGSQVSVDPTVKDPPTVCKIKGSIYRVSIRGSCNSYFYFALLTISSNVDNVKNPMNLRNVNKSNRFVPLITVPKTPHSNPVYDSLGIYPKYDIYPFDAKNIGKVLEYVQNCRYPSTRLCNQYVVNDEYAGSPFYADMRQKTLRTLKQKPKFNPKFRQSRRVRKALGIERA